MAYSRKAINFDLSTADLKKYFKNTAEAYNQIKNFMLQNGFEHRQYSGYVSNDKLHDYDITNLTIRLQNQFSWLYPCTQKFDVTDIGDQHDLMSILADVAQQQPQQQIPYSKDTLDKQNAIKAKVVEFAKSKANKESPNKDIER